jgi:TusA-related sulfurtransferase
MMMSGVSALTENRGDVFVELATGGLSGLLDWDEFDQVCESIMQSSDAGWYIYAVDEQPPQQMASSAELNRFITTLKERVHREYGREHCGIAFVDSRSEPALFKIFNPKLLKSICNIYGNAPLHGWIISRHRPVDLRAVTPVNAHAPDDKNRITKAAKILDARHAGCPLPIINTCRALQGLAKGQLLEIMTIEPGAVKDVSIVCERTGDTLVSHEQTRYGYSLFVEKK